MLKPSLTKIVRDEDSFYAFVVAVAKRARKIAEVAEEKGVSLDEKPVNLAVEEFASGKIKVADVARMKDIQPPQ